MLPNSHTDSPPNNCQQMSHVHKDRHRPTRAAKSVRYMTKAKKTELERQAQALHACEAAGKLPAIIGRAAWIRAHISSKFLQAEPKLSASCWPEYLYLDPLERTRRFTAEYLRAYKYFAQRIVDHRKVAHLSPIDEVLEYNAPASISSLWRARQHADELCIPYEKYLYPLIQHALEEEGHKRVPLPNQLYDLAQIEHVLERWKEWVQDGTFVTREWDDRLKAANFQNSLAQRHCHKVLFDLIGRSVGRLEQFMLSDGLLPESVARERLGDDLVDRALDRHGTVRTPTSPSACAVYIRPCLGVVASRVSACKECPFAERCERVSLRVDQEMSVVYRSTDPRQDHVRELARLRQQRKRERDRKRDREPTFEEA